MMFGQAIRGEHEWKSGIARRREPIFAARKPKLRWISIMRIKFIRDRGFDRLVVGRFSFYKTGNVYARPFCRVPPHQFFPFAPGMTVWPRTGAVIDDAAIA